MNWDVVGLITNRETIAEGNSIRELKRLRDHYGGTTWRKKKGIAMVRFLPGGPTVKAEVHGYEASLEVRKLYRCLDDAHADALDMVRVVDESGEDYLYPAKRFQPIRITKQLEHQLFTHAA